jgi:ribosomal protein S18 acetylase RimI-like enzyme
MSGDEYGKRLKHERGFKEKVEALDQAEAQRRQARA